MHSHRVWVVKYMEMIKNGFLLNNAHVLMTFTSAITFTLFYGHMSKVSIHMPGINKHNGAHLRS